MNLSAQGPLSILVLFATLGCGDFQLGEDPFDQAQTRVEFVLETIRDSGDSTSTELQTAICRWERDKILMDRDALDLAANGFDRWRRQAEIYPTLGSFEILEIVESIKEEDPEGTFYFRLKIDGVLWWLRVPPQARMSWYHGHVE